VRLLFSQLCDFKTTFAVQAHITTKLYIDIRFIITNNSNNVTLNLFSARLSVVGFYNYVFIDYILAVVFIKKNFKFVYNILVIE